MVKRAYRICSNKELLNVELDHLRNVICNISDYPLKFVNNIIWQVKITLTSQTIQQPLNQTILTQEVEQDKFLQLTLPCASKVGDKMKVTLC